MRLISKDLGPKFSEGARLLWIAVQRERLTLVALAKEVGRGQGTVSRWMHGIRIPDEDSRRELHRRFGVPSDIEMWRRKPTQKFHIPRSRQSETVSTISTARNGSV